MVWYGVYGVYGVVVVVVVVTLMLIGDVHSKMGFVPGRAVLVIMLAKGRR